jgi:hypothetical protein
MKKRDIRLWQFVGFGVVSLGGTLLHFLFELTGGSPLVAPFSGVNESTWEHMKLLFFPLFLFAGVEYFFFRHQLPNFWCVKLRGTLLGLVLIPLIFYTYNGVFGKSPDWVNISIFFLACAMVFLWETQAFTRGNIPCKNPKLAFFTLCAVAALFIIFTFSPPQIPLFLDPLTNTYGYQG